MYVIADLIRVVHFVTRQRACASRGFLVPKQMDSDTDVHMSDAELLPRLSKGKGKLVDLPTLDSDSLPWYGCAISQEDFANKHRVEKYRPVTLDDVFSHKDITSTSKNNNDLCFVLSMS